MRSLLLLLPALVLSQQAAVRRTTPASDDPGMVVRQAGPLTVNGISPLTDGGVLGAVLQGPGLTDGGSWAVFCLNCAGGSSGSAWVPDGGTIGYTRMPDGGPQEVYAVNPGLTDTQLRASAVPVSVTSLPLPAGAATSALQTTGNTSLNSIDTKTPAAGQAVMAASSPVVIASNQSAIPMTLTSTTVTSGSITATQATGTNLHMVTDTGSTTAVTGTVAVTGPLTDTQLRASAVPVTLASTTITGTVAATQSTSRDGGYDWGVNVDNFPATQVVSGTVTANAGTGTMTVGQATGTNLHVVVDTAPTTAVTAAALPLPTGASTSALQTTGNTSLSNIDGKTPALGQAVMTSSVPVVIASNQSTVPVSGSVTVSGTVTTTPPANATTNVTQFGGTNISTGTGTGGVGIPRVTVSSDSSLSATVSGTVTANAGTNLNTSALALSANQTTLGSQTTKLNDGTNTAAVKPASVAAIATDPALVVTVSPNNAVAITAAALPLPSGAATSALQTTGNTSLGSIDTKTPALGQGVMTASSPVVIASNQSSIPVTLTSTTITGTVAATQSGTWNSRTQDGAGNALASSTTTPAGTEQALIVRPIPSGTQAVSGTVTANAGTGTMAVSAAALPLPTGAATETTLGTRLADATFTGRFPAAGALADTTANPTTTGSATYLMGYNGTTWDRIRSSTTLGVTVNISNTTLAVTQSGTWNVGLSAGTNYFGRTRITDATLDLSLLNSAPGSDTGQISIPVRVISSLAGGAGGTSSSFGAAFPASGTAAGGSVTTSAPTYVTGNMGGLSLNTSGGLRVDGSGVTQPVSAASLPLPTGAATSSNQTTLGSQTTKLNDGTNTATVKPASTAAIATDTAIVVAISPNNSLTVGNASVGLTGAASPASAALAGAKVSTGSPSVVNGNMEPVSLTLAGALRTDSSATTQPVSGNVGISGTPAVTITSGTTTVTQATGTNLHVVVDTAPTTAITAAALPLPTGAATSALQTTGNTSVASLDTKLPVQGQAVMASSVPVVIASNQSAVPVTMTSTTITGTVVVSGTVTANAGTGTMAVSAASLPLPTGAATETTLAKIPVAQSAALGTNTQVLTGGSVTTAAPTYTTGNVNPLSLTTAGGLRVDGSGTTQPISGSLTNISGTISLPTGAATESSLVKLPVAQGSATSGQSGPLGQGAVTTAAPAYTTAQTSPLSLTTSGDLRTRPVSTGTTNAALPTTAIAIGGSDGTNLQVPRLFDMDTSGGTSWALGTSIVAANFGAPSPITSQGNSSGALGLVVYDLRKVTKLPLTSTITCATTATAAPAVALTNRLALTMMNNSSVTIYIGGSAVTTSTGIPLLPGASFMDEVEDSPYFCIVASGTANLRILEN